MQRAQKGRWVQTLMALLLIWGASASAVASLGCSLGICRHGCPMTAAPRPVTPDGSAMRADHSCCASGQIGKAERQSVGSDAKSPSACSCQLSQAQTPVSGVHSAMPAPPAPDAVALPDRPTYESSEPPARLPRIFAFADASPPPIPWHPDFGRAPPTR